MDFTNIEVEGCAWAQIGAGMGNHSSKIRKNCATA